MITITINNVRSTISGLNRETFGLLNDELAFEVPGARFMKAYTKGWWDNEKKKWCHWDGYRRLLSKNKKGCFFLTGLVNRAKDLLDNYHVEYEVIDNRKEPKNCKPIKIKNEKKIDKRPYQDDVFKTCLLNSRGIVKAATGSGKSIMILQLVAQRNVRTNVYVTGVDLLYQLHNTFKFFGIDAGIIGDGQCEIKKINIISIWTAASALGAKYKPMGDDDMGRKEKLAESNKALIADAIKKSQMNVFDECHCISTDTVQIINNNSISSYYSYGFSGTPWREDNSELLIEGVCGSIICNITATELINSGYLVRPTIHFISIPKSTKKYNKKYPSVYKNYVVENDIRNSKIVKAADKLVASGRKTLILVKSIKHGKILFDELSLKHSVHFLSGSVSSYTRNEIKKSFSEGNIDILIASVIFDQGIDLPVLSGLILAGSGKSSGRALQRIGRVIRLCEGKKNAIVVDFIDNEKFLLDHTRSRAEIYRTEPGFVLKFPKTR
jgi:superfamily II DNA or RNA helicase